MGILRIEGIQRRQERFLLLRGILRFIQELFDLDFSIDMTIISLMGKKNLTKSSDQKESLELFYRRKPSGWKREEIVQISSSLGLSRQQVYKWLWDRKKLSCARIKQQHHSVRSSSQQSAAEYYAVKYLKYNIHVPVNKQQAMKFAVHPSVSLWAQYMLKMEGWQLVRNSPGMHVRRNMNFSGVKQEEANQPYALDSSDHVRIRQPKVNIFKSIPQLRLDDSENIFESS